MPDEVNIRVAEHCVRHYTNQAEAFQALSEEYAVRAAASWERAQMWRREQLRWLGEMGVTPLVRPEPPEDQPA